MSHPHQTRLQPAVPRLTLVTSEIEDASGFAPKLAAVLDAADVAAVLLRLPAADEDTQINRVKTLAAVAQDQGVALLVDGHPDIVARGGADGAHLRGFEAFAAARGTLKPDRIAGCGGVATRHDAMLAAENGADYVMFGDALDGSPPSFQTVLERVEWWTEVFEIPCVALASGFDEISPLAAAGADFVAVGDFIWSDPRGSAAALAAAAARLAARETVA